MGYLVYVAKADNATRSAWFITTMVVGSLLLVGIGFLGTGGVRNSILSAFGNTRYSALENPRTRAYREEMNPPSTMVRTLRYVLAPHENRR
jgi:hypothetical protein